MENSLSFVLSKFHSQFGCSCIDVIVRIDLRNHLHTVLANSFGVIVFLIFNQQCFDDISFLTSFL